MWDRKYLSHSFLCLTIFRINGVTDLCVFWGQAKYDWSAQAAAVYLAVLLISPGVGALIGSGLLYPSQLRYAKSIALMLFSAAVGCVLEGLVFTDGRIGHRPIHPRDGGRRVYFAIPALLTPDVAPGKQGHLQGALSRGRDARVRCGIGHLPRFCSTRCKPFLNGASEPVGSVLLLRGSVQLRGRRAHHRGRGRAKHLAIP